MESEENFGGVFSAWKGYDSLDDHILCSGGWHQMKSKDF